MYLKINWSIKKAAGHRSSMGVAYFWSWAPIASRNFATTVSYDRSMQ